MTSGIQKRNEVRIMVKKAVRIFNGATAVITGGASGIGRALAEELAKYGSEIILADLQLELAEEVALSIQASGGKARAVKLDVTDFAAVDNLLQDTVKHTGKLDFMFNNAGIFLGGPIGRHAIEDWNRIIDVNLRGAVNGTHAAYKIMKRQGFGHIVNTASTMGLLPVGMGMPAYATIKHAIVALATTLRAELSFDGIRISTLCPGVIRTPILINGGEYGKYLGEMSEEEQKKYWEQFKPISADSLAKKALRAVAKNKPIIVIPAKNKLYWWISRLSPSLLILMDKLDFKKRLKNGKRD